MKVALLDSSKIYFKSQPQDDYTHLHGNNAVKNYIGSKNRLQQVDDEKYVEVQQVIYNSLQSMAAYGQYQAFKTLFKNIEQEEELKSYANLYNTAGNVYKAEHDIEKAHQLYNTAYEAVSPNEELFFDVERNYLESCYQLNENIDERLEVLKNRKEPHSTVNYLELSSFKDLKNGKTDDAKNKILSAYLVAKNNNIVNDDLYYKAAVIMSSNSQFENSTIVCKNRLDRLKKENKTFTHEFLNYLTLLGINNYFTKGGDLEKAKNTLLNAQQLEKSVKDPRIEDELNFYLLKIDYHQPDMNTIFKKSTEYINNTKNTSHQKNICNSAAEYALKLGKDGLLTAEESKEFAKPYYEKLEEILTEEEKTNEKELVDLYLKLQEIYPELETTYNEKINKLTNHYDLPLKQMIAGIDLDVARNDEEKLQIKLNNILQDSKIDSVRKGVALNYKLLLKLNKGIDFQKNARELQENLNNLYLEYTKERSNKVLAENIYNSYNRLANIQYNASNYYESALASDKVNDLAQDLKLPKDKLEELKVYSTLRWYKAKIYYKAEDRCLEFLNLLTGVDKNNARSTHYETYINGRTESQCKKIASTIETLGIINLKNKNYKDAIKYYEKAVEIREKLSSRDIYLANDYAALARLAILGYEIFGDNISSKEMHNKCMALLDEKFPNTDVAKEEHAFHKKYYGFSLTSMGKFLGFRDESAIIDKFKCYNRELNICE